MSYRRIGRWLLCVGWAMASWPVAVSGQTEAPFRGQLIDDTTGTAIAGASIAVAGAAGTVHSDAGGHFSWAPAPAVPFELVVVLAGGHVVGPLSVRAVDRDVTVIRLGAYASEAVIVLGAAPSVNSPPASATTVLPAAHIAQRAPGTLGEALESVPGISRVSEGHAAVPAVRGLARGRTLLLIDGARISAERRVGPGATFLDPSVVEAIDIARGPGSVAYGSDALGGVISIRTRRAEPGSPLRARVTGTIGAGTPEGRGALEVSRGLARGGVLVQAHLRRAGDYDSPAGPVFNSGWADQGVLVHVTYAIRRGFLSAVWQSDHGRDIERPRNNSRAIRISTPVEDSQRLTASYTLPAIGGFRELAVTGFFGTSGQRTEQDRAATSGAGRLLEQADVSARDFHVKASARRVVHAARVDFGVDVNGRSGLQAVDVVREFDRAGVLSHRASHPSVDAANRVDVGTYVQADTALSRRLRVAGGARGDRITTRNAGGYFGEHTTASATGSGFAALTAGPFAGLTVTAQVARGFRDPTLSDRYFRGISGRGFITGNPSLRPETSLQYDLAARYTAGATQLAVFAYRYRITGLIERYQTEPDHFFFRNRGRARVQGLELESRSHLGRGYSIEIGAHLARGRALDDGTPLDDIPAPVVSVLGRKDVDGRWYTLARAAWHAGDERPGPGEIAMPGAVLVDAGGGWHVAPGLELRLLTRNLLQAEYYASPDPRWVLAPGRSFSLTAVVRF